MEFRVRHVILIKQVPDPEFPFCAFCASCGYFLMSEDLRQFLRWDDFKLGVGAIGGLFVFAPSSKLGGVSETASLHVVVCDFHDQLHAERLPRQVLARTPATLASGHALIHFSRPMFPGMIGQRIFAIRREEFDKLPSLLFCKAGTDADVLQGACIVEEPQQK